VSEAIRQSAARSGAPDESGLRRSSSGCGPGSRHVPAPLWAAPACREFGQSGGRASIA